MCPRNPTLSGREVHDRAAALLHTRLRPADYGRTCPAGMLVGLILAAAAWTGSLSDACRRLLRAPSDETARKALLAFLPSPAELERRLNLALLADLPKALLRRRHPLAADLTLVPYHGRYRDDPKEVCRSKAGAGTSHFHAYATLYVVRKGLRFTVALTAVAAGEPLVGVLERLLERAARAGVKPSYLLLDRGFYSVAVIRRLQRRNLAFVMPAVRRGRPRADGTGIGRFFTARLGGWAAHTLTGSAGTTATVRIAVACRNWAGKWGRRGRQRLVYAVWGVGDKTVDWVRRTYRLRFGIETSYRQMHEGRARTSTRDPRVRLLYVGVALILRNVWAWLHWTRLSTPRRGGRRLRPERLRLRVMLLWLMHVIEHLLGVRDEVGVERYP